MGSQNQVLDILLLHTNQNPDANRDELFEEYSKRLSQRGRGFLFIVEANAFPPEFIESSKNYDPFVRTLDRELTGIYTVPVRHLGPFVTNLGHLPENSRIYLASTEGVFRYTLERRESTPPNFIGRKVA